MNINGFSSVCGCDMVFRWYLVRLSVGSGVVGWVRVWVLCCVCVASDEKIVV